MSCEHGLKATKCSAGKHCCAERLRCGGVLAEAMKRYVAAGGADSRRQTKEDLLQKNVPLSCAEGRDFKRRRKANSGSLNQKRYGRFHIRYANFKAAEFQKQFEFNVSAESIYELKSLAMEEWADMDEADRNM